MAVADTALISLVPFSLVLVLESSPLPHLHQDLLAAQWENRLLLRPNLSLLRLLRPFNKLRLRLKKLSLLQSLPRLLPLQSQPLLRSLLQRLLRLLRPMLRKLSLPSLISCSEAPWPYPPAWLDQTSHCKVVHSSVAALASAVFP